jgi:predicted TIM-barrel fold metal-dependent hydrolase
MYIFDAYTRFFGRDFYEFQTVPRPDGGSEILLMQRGRDDSGDRLPVAHRRRLLDDMDKCGVSRAVVYASVPPQMSVVGEAALESNGRLVPFAVVNPLSQSSLAQLGTLQERYRFRGMILFPFLHEYAVGGREAAAALDFAAAHDMVVFFHCGAARTEVRRLIGLDSSSPIDHGRTKSLIAAVKSRADQMFTVPYSGEHQFEEFLELGASCPNVHAITVGSSAGTHDRAPSLTLADWFSETRRVYGEKRILYASGSEGSAEGYRKDVLEAQIAAMIEAGFTEAGRAAVLGGNLSRLLGEA